MLPGMTRRVRRVVGVGGFATAALVGGGDGGVFGGGDANLYHLVVAFEFGMDFVAAAVFVVVGLVVRDIGAEIAVSAADLAFKRAVEAAVAADHRAGGNLIGFFVELRVFADKLHRARH